MKFKKKPVVIDADRVTEANIADIAAWCAGKVVGDGHDHPAIQIATLEGTMTAMVGDWVIRGVQGEFYPCKHDIFDATYYPV